MRRLNSTNAWHVGPFISILLLITLSGCQLPVRGWTPPWTQMDGPLTASGTLEADEYQIGAEVAGKITEIVQEGQSVQRDDILVKLDDAMIQLQYQQGDVAARQRLEIQDEFYQLHSPIAGVVTRAPMHVGEVVAPGQTVVAIADLSTLKLTAYVLKRDLGQVQIGQQVTVTVDPFPERAFHGSDVHLLLNSEQQSA